MIMKYLEAFSSLKLATEWKEAVRTFVEAIAQKNHYVCDCFQIWLHYFLEDLKKFDFKPPICKVMIESTDWQR